MKAWRGASLGLLLLAACAAGRAHFRPTERATAESPGGRPAAEYEVSAAGERWGEVRVWCEDALVEDSGQAVVLVAFELENALDAPLALDAADTCLWPGEAPEPLLPRGAAASEAAAPHAVRVIALRFCLPDGVEPGELQTLRVRWRLRGPEGRMFEQHTGFTRDRPWRTATPDPWPWHWRASPFC